MIHCTHILASLVLVMALLAEQSNSKGPTPLLDHGRVVVCYVSSWAAYRPGRGAFSLDDLDPKLCTHLVYAFAGLNITTGQLRSLDPYRDLEENYGLGWYSKLTDMKRRHPHLKVTLAVGGWNEGSANYSKMAADPTLRKAFVESSVQTLQMHNFDGLDLDWEYPSLRGGVPDDKQNFITLIKELRTALSPLGMILTAALGAGKATIDAAYDIPALSSLLDLMHVMCYDYHGAWDRRTGPNAPLATRDPADLLSVTATINYLKKLGAPVHKMVLGVPLYGRTFLLSRPGGEVVDRNKKNVKNLSYGFGVAALEKGFQGPYTKEDGFMAYNEICLEMDMPDSEWSQFWDDATQSPYAENKERWISFSNEKSVTASAKFSILEDLAGVMVWSVDTDDFQGDCPGGVRYPLLRTLNLALGVTQRDLRTSTSTSGNMWFPLSLGLVVVAALAVGCLWEYFRRNRSGDDNTARQQQQINNGGRPLY